MLAEGGQASIQQSWSLLIAQVANTWQNHACTLLKKVIADGCSMLRCGDPAEALLCQHRKGVSAQGTLTMALVGQKKDK